MARRHRKRPDARRAPNRDPGRRILIVCEGEVTEREYFEGFRRWCKNPRVVIAFDGPAGVPLTLVGRAKQRRDEADLAASRAGDDFLRYDEVWCVFDVDEHPHVVSAREGALAAGLRIAMSNPCFELWLLLHFADNPGMQPRPTVGIQFVDIPEFADLGTKVAQGVSAAISGQQTVQQALDAGQVLAEDVAKKYAK